MNDDRKPGAGLWKVVVTTFEGKSFTYKMDTERDADAFAAAIYFHSDDILETQVAPC